MLNDLFYKKPACACRAGREEGITLIEVIIATFILLVAVVGSYVAFTQISVATSSASNRLVAAYLAQEGIEIMRNIRDTNWIKNGVIPTTWDSLLNNCSAECQIDYKTGSSIGPLGPIPLYNSAYLNIGADGFYTYNITNTTPTKFKRSIEVLQPDTNRLEIKADVTWDDRGKYYNLVAEEILYNWK